MKINVITPLSPRLPAHLGGPPEEHDGSGRQMADFGQRQFPDALSARRPIWNAPVHWFD